eukprot:1712539-Amphidinium_carterae.1
MPFQVLDNDPRMHITNANINQMRIPLHAAKLQVSRKQSISTISTLLLFAMVCPTIYDHGRLRLLFEV